MILESNCTGISIEFLHMYILALVSTNRISYTLSLKDVFKTVWVGKINGVGVYATHFVKIWWFRNKFSLFQLKRM